MDIKYNTVEELKGKAAEIELAGVNFLKEDGSFANGAVAYIHRAEFIFIDGVKLLLPWADVQTPEFAALEFKLAPSRADA